MVNGTLSGWWLKLKEERGSSPKGVNDLCFHTFGGLNPPPSPSPPSLPPLTKILASRPESKPWDPNPLDLGLKARIWALMLGSESRGGTKKKATEEEKIPICVKAKVIDPFWSHCPKRHDLAFARVVLLP